MSGLEWLAANNKEPFNVGHFWYWGTEEDKDAVDRDSDSLLLPPAIFNLLSAKTTYPNCKLYFTKENALEDFGQAYERANL